MDWSRRATATASIMLGIGILACVLDSIEVCKVITHTGGAGAMITVSLILLLVDAERWLPLPVGLIASSTVTVILKTVIDAPRPPSDLWLVDAEGGSMPSGHAAATAAFWTLLYLSTRRREVILVGVMHTLAVSLSRVMLRVHYPADVVVGMIQGPLVASIAWVLYSRGYAFIILVLSSISSVIVVLYEPGYKTPLLILALSLLLLVVYLRSSRGTSYHSSQASHVPRAGSGSSMRSSSGSQAPLRYL